MKTKIKAMTNREWAQKHTPDQINIKKFGGGVAGCPDERPYKLEKHKCGDCSYCWNLPAKRNGKYIMRKEVKNGRQHIHN